MRCARWDGDTFILKPNRNVSLVLSRYDAILGHEHAATDAVLVSLMNANYAIA